MGDDFRELALFSIPNHVMQSELLLELKYLSTSVAKITVAKTNNNNKKSNLCQINFEHNL